MTGLPQRPLRGSRISTFYPIKSLPSLSSLDSAFQLQEYISLLIRLNVHDVEAIVTLPGKPTDKEKQADSEQESPEGTEKKPEDNGKNDVMVDEACWIYEQLRRVFRSTNHFFAELGLQTARAGPNSSLDHNASAGMHARVMS